MIQVKLLYLNHLVKKKMEEMKYRTSKFHNWIKHMIFTFVNHYFIYPKTNNDSLYANEDQI